MLNRSERTWQSEPAERALLRPIELILNAANLNFIALSRYLQETGNVNAVAGQIFAVFVIVVAAAEAAIGLGIVIALYRNKETIWVDEIDILKW